MVRQVEFNLGLDNSQQYFTHRAQLDQCVFIILGIGYMVKLIR